MKWKNWEDLPHELQSSEVRAYYDILQKKKNALIIKRVFDVCASFVLLVILLPVFLLLAIAIKLDSPGPVFYRQVRVTQYGEQFRIFKFRSMVQNADRRGSLVTVQEDKRITRVGKIIRKFRLDELCQLIDVLRGKMTFVGTRPEVPKYVEHYTPQMMATLLLPAGVTSEASIYYKSEARLLSGKENPDSVYVEQILPQKMQYNLQYVESFSFWKDIGIMFKTVFAVFAGEREEN